MKFSKSACRLSKISALTLTLIGSCALHSGAQIIPPVYGFTETPIASFTTTGPTPLDDVITNCDMLETPQGKIKAIAWSDWMNASVASAAMGEFYVEDYLGHSVTTLLPQGSLHPDIVLANAQDPGTPGTDYQVLVVYFTFDPASPSPSSMGTATLDVYDLIDVGLPTFHLQIKSSKALTTTPNCNGFPHIDMWSDASNPVDGYPGLHRFACVWSAGGSFANMDIYTGDAISASTGSFLSVTYTLPGSAFMPDIACLTDISSGSPKDVLEVVYGQGYSDALVRTTYANNLKRLELDVTTPGSTPTIHGPYNSSWQVFAPRIEAMSQYDSGRGTSKWQIATSQDSANGFQVYGYNSLMGTTQTNMSSLLAPLYASFPYQYIGMGATVAAGIGPSLSSGIGNFRYNTGFFPWQHDSVYARDVDILTGALVNPIQCYQINNVVSPVDYPWDVNQSLSMASSSNSGNDWLTTWYNGSNVVYKVSTPNVMGYRQTPTTVGTPMHANIAIHPNPVQNILYCPGNDGEEFSILDFSGKTIVRGQLTKSGVDVHQFPAGTYYLIFSNAENKPIKFVKQ